MPRPKTDRTQLSVYYHDADIAAIEDMTVLLNVGREVKVARADVFRALVTAALSTPAALNKAKKTLRESQTA